jgi:5-methylcytosine-specific restriction endonuclease McrA
MDSIRFCKKHGECEHVLSSGKWRCKKCRSEAVQKRRDKIKLMSIEYKGGKCEICGYDKCIDALEFHHLNPNEKDFGIAEKGYTRSFDKVKEELDKCILVCANCHREIHHKDKKRNVYELLNEIHNKQEKAITSKKERKQIPTIDEFISVFKMYLNFTQVGKYFGVTDNSVRKWCKKYGLPIHTKELCRYIHNM